MPDLSHIHHKITYAQNREDLVLAGILKSVPDSEGFYIDVGANYPTHDSVTKLFYDKGWSGINIEPNADLHAMLMKERPRDLNLPIGLSSQPGTLVFRQYGERDGLATFSQDMKASYGDSGYTESSVTVSTLREVISQHRPSGPIHFLKVDVEGLELEVLVGNPWHSYRPWVVCLERSLHHDRKAMTATLFASFEYAEVFFDGVNDYFIANEHMDLWRAFSYAGDVVLNGIPLYYLFAKGE